MALAVYRQAQFTMLHVVGKDQAIDFWAEFPQVRGTLERWGLLEEGSEKSAVSEKLALDVAKINVRDTDPLKAILGYLGDRPTDLIVLATEGRDGLPRWIKPSLAERVSRRSRAMTLFVPHGSGGFVSLDTGEVRLKRILVPVDRKPSPQSAITYAARAAVMSPQDDVTLSALHIGATPDWPAWELPQLKTCTVEKVHRDGPVVEEIVKAAEDLSADLIVMATEGTTGVLDMLRGSVTQQVLRSAPCPVLAVPSTRGY
jgi:nucleotide-binding universal stress UspA family protein